MFPAAPTASFPGNVAYRGILVIYFSVFQIYYVLLSFLTLYYDIRNTPVCHGGAKLRYGYPRSITFISTFFYGLLRSDAVSCALTMA